MLVPLALGDADGLELGDDLAILGYPGIGSSTITLTGGTVSGFLQERGVTYQRAWIKTDAAISGGNSGGTAVDETGKLVAVPTRLGDIDVRRIADTNGDGIIDDSDDALSTGGFINQMRPINLALPLIERALRGAVMPDSGKPSIGALPTPQPTPAGRPSTGPAMGPFTFASEVDARGLPVDPAARFAGGIEQLYAFTDYAGFTNQALCEYEWTIDRDIVAEGAFAWVAGAAGKYSFSLSNGGDALPDGEYGLTVHLAGKRLQQGGVTVYSAAERSTVALSGYLYDADTGRAIQDGYCYVLAPGVTVQAFLNEQRETQVAAVGISGRTGYYSVAPPLARGNTYSVVVYARGYDLIAEDGALPIGASTPAAVELGPIRLSRE